MRLASKQAEATLEKSIAAIYADLPLSEEELEATIRKVVASSVQTLRTAMAASGQSPAEIQDALRHCDTLAELKSMSLRQKNKEETSRVKVEADKLLSESVEEMRRALRSSMAEISAASQPVSLSEMNVRLNKKFFSVRDALVSSIRGLPLGGHMEAAAASELEKECKGMKVELDAHYGKVVVLALRAAADEFGARLEKDSEQLLSGAFTNEQIQEEFQRIENSTKEAAVRETSVWSCPPGDTFSS